MRAMQELIKPNTSRDTWSTPNMHLIHMNQKASAGIFIIIGIIVMAIVAVAFSMGAFNNVTSPNPAPGYATLSEDPKYKDVKEKYNLNEEQLQILSTVNPDDND